MVTCVSRHHGIWASPRVHLNGARDRLGGYHTLEDVSGMKGSTGEKGTNVHILIDWVSAVSIPHRLDGSTPGGSTSVSPEPATGNDFAQAIDIGVQWKRRSDLPYLFRRFVLEAS